jgi:collagen type IV alpha-3-binding protein
MLCVAATVEQMTVIETIAEDTLVFLQVHKRIWPASQRDSLFWSHMRQVPDHNDRDGHDIWIVCNHSTENPDFPVSFLRFTNLSVATFPVTLTVSHISNLQEVNSLWHPAWST